ncbi:hypothetical protein BC941DRAFT_473777 [Chlamydoabsidia padenii]|nr:hypothetical protein BC941DRAFT_473777 [Chlamydoabsidia padenii]
MGYFTTRHYNTNVSTETIINNDKGERQPLQSTDSKQKHPSLIPTNVSSPDDIGSLTASPPRPTVPNQATPLLVDQSCGDTLQSASLHLTPNDALEHELRWLTVGALMVCLFCSVSSTLLVYLFESKSDYACFQIYIQLLLVLAWCFLGVVWKQQQQIGLLWAQRLCLVTAASLLTTWCEYTYALLAILSACLFLFYTVQRLIKSTLYHNQAITNEVHHAALMILTTLEQCSPSIILNQTQELLSACSIAVPTTSISAIQTTLKQLCHVNSLARPIELSCCGFDIGDLCQSVGDALAGLAATLDVKLVLYHSESGLHHTQVIGDEAALRHALLDLLRNVLEGSTPGACIELGLGLMAVENNKKRTRLIFDITHTCSPSIPGHLSSTSILLPNPKLTTQLIEFIGGQLLVDSLSNGQTRFKVKVEMDLGDNGDDSTLFINSNKTPLMSALHKSYHHIKFANEPTMKELEQFMENLKGLKMVLHAKEQSVFAKHLTGCLASWNCDISHVPVSRLDDDDNGLSTDENTPTTPLSDAATATTPLSASDLSFGYSQHRRHTLESKGMSLPSPLSPATPHVPSPVTEEEQLLSIPPAFVFIDDDILTLERKLLEFRTRSGTRRHKHASKSTTHAIIHFASLGNYKQMRDVIQWAATLSTPYAMPRIVVVPKPSGPRRYLTALYTAWHNAMVEPHYIPMATSPGSPVPTVLLSSMLSQVIDQTYTPPATSQKQQQSIRRPSNGGSNYFFDRSDMRRRSQPDGLSNNNVAEPVLEATTTDVTDTTAILPSIPPSIPVSNCGALDALITHLPTPAPIQDTPELLVDPPLLDSTVNTVIPDSAKSRPRLTGVKLAKRKKKEKESLFANVVSPPINVLIVEDNMINQAILSAWMKKHKIKFSVASNGQEAVEKWKGGGFHLVLMDIQLPVMSGIEATKAIRLIEKENKIGVLPMSSSFLRQQQQQQSKESVNTAALGKTDVMEMASPTTTMTTLTTSSSSNPSTFRSPVIIVALTASSLESDRHAALAAGCNDFLTKPVSLEWLEKKIIEWGCMQALIDFEGWRRWKRSAHDVANLKNQQGAPHRHGMEPPGQPSFLGQVSPLPPALCSQDLLPVGLDNKTSDSFTLLDGRKGMLLPGAIGLNKRRYSTMDKQVLRRHYTIGRSHPQKTYSEVSGGKRKTTKKAISVDDYMRGATFVG